MGEGDDSSSFSSLREVDEDVEDEPWYSGRELASDPDSDDDSPSDVAASPALGSAPRRSAPSPRLGGDAHNSEADTAEVPPPREEESLFHRVAECLGQARPPVFVRCPICTITQLSIRGLEIYEPEDEYERTGLPELAPGVVLVCGHMVCGPCWQQYVVMQRGEVAEEDEEGVWEEVEDESEDDDDDYEEMEQAEEGAKGALPNLIPNPAAANANPPPLILPAPARGANAGFIDPLKCPVCRVALRYRYCLCDIETPVMPLHPLDPSAPAGYRETWAGVAYSDDRWAAAFPRTLNDGAHIFNMCDECIDAVDDAMGWGVDEEVDEEEQ